MVNEEEEREREREKKIRIEQNLKVISNVLRWFTTLCECLIRVQSIYKENKVICRSGNENFLKYESIWTVKRRNVKSTGTMNMQKIEILLLRLLLLLFCLSFRVHSFCAKFVWGAKKYCVRVKCLSNWFSYRRFAFFLIFLKFHPTQSSI